MLTLILAAALTGTPGDLLATCDGNAMTEPCRTYLAGFVHAAEAYERLLSDLVRDGVNAPRVVCLPEHVDLDAVRGRVVKLRRAIKSRTAESLHAPMLALNAVSGLYPCSEAAGRRARP